MVYYLYAHNLWNFNMYDDDNYEYKDPKLSDQELDILRKWHTYNARILRFQRNASLFTFQEVFGMDIAQHLFLNFRFECQHDYQKFTTYLTVDQQNDLLIHILRCPRYK